MNPATDSSGRRFAFAALLTLLVSGIVLFVLFARRDYLRLAETRRLHSPGFQTLPPDVSARVRALVVLRSPVESSSPVLVDFLLKHLPAAQEVVLAGSDESDFSWQPETGSKIRLGDPIRVPPLEQPAAGERTVILGRLRELADRWGEDAVLVDVTRSTTGMSLSLSEAARAVGVGVTYTPFRRGDGRSGQYTGIYLRPPLPPGLVVGVGGVA